MTTETITLTAICPGGNHLTFTGSGAKDIIVRADLDSLGDAVTDDDAAAFVRVICKMAKAGRTNAQAKTLLQAGVTVTV